MLPVRLLVAASAVGGLALTGLSPAPAHAAPAVDGEIHLQSNLSYDGTDCSGATAPSGVNATFTTGTTVKRTLSFDQTATANLDPTDKVHFKGSQTVSVSSSAAGGQVSSLTAVSSVTGSISGTKTDSTCTPSGFPASSGRQAEVQASVHRTTAGWLHIQASSVGTGGQILQGGFGGGPLLEVQFGGFAVRDLSHDQWVYVPAGDYDVEVGLGGATALDFGLSTASLKQSVKFSFLPAGIARTATSGTARSKVVFPTTLTCSTGKAVARLTSKVRGASRVTFYVNGVKKQSYVRPGARTVVLTGVPKNRAVTLKAVVKDGRRTLTAARAYRSC